MRRVQLHGKNCQAGDAVDGFGVASNSLRADHRNALRSDDVLIGLCNARFVHAHMIDI